MKKTDFFSIHFLKKNLKNCNNISSFNYFLLIRTFGKGNFEYGQFFNFLETIYREKNKKQSIFHSFESDSKIEK